MTNGKLQLEDEVNENQLKACPMSSHNNKSEIQYEILLYITENV